jgi:voltage-gated potassium channel
MTPGARTVNLEQSMAFTLHFLQVFALGILYTSPILLFLLGLIMLLGFAVGRSEGWPRGDALYFAFVTATTVGYGDFHPAGLRGKTLAILIALIGLVLTGILVAIGIEAVRAAFEGIDRG